MKDDVPSVKGVLRGYRTGRQPTDNCIRIHKVAAAFWFHWNVWLIAIGEKEEYPSWQSVKENSLSLKRQKRNADRKST